MSELDNFIRFVRGAHGVRRFDVRWKDRRYPDDPAARRAVEMAAKVFVGGAYYTDFATSIYPFAYLPANLRLHENETLDVTRHEAVHVIDHHKHPLRFPLTYVTPLAPWRAEWELRGYAQTMIALKERTGAVRPKDIDKIVELFKGRSYGW